MKNPRRSGSLLTTSIAPKGFALIATITLMVLLAILAIGMLSLSTVSLRSSTHSDAITQARANARVALITAIAELQRNTGTDTRVTASANIVDEDYPPLVGVWRSWEGLNHETTGATAGRPIRPDYGIKNQPSTSGNGRFVTWLVSSAMNKGNLVVNDPPNLVRTAAQSDTIPLLSVGSLQAGDTRQVHVVPTDLQNGGRLAWWVSGENQKARLAQPYAPRTNDVAGLAQLGQSYTVANPEAFGMMSLIGDPEPNDASTAPAKAGRKAVSRQNMALIEANNPIDPQNKFHDFSTQSTGLLTNTATGGWRKDLSILTEKWHDPLGNDGIYNKYPGGRLPLFRYTPASGSTSSVPRPTSTTANHSPAQSNLYPWSNASRIIGTSDLPSTLHSASASWQSLRNFATAYKNFTYSGGTIVSPFVWDAIVSPSTTLNHTHIFNYRHTQRLHPQVARFQFVVYARAFQTSAAGVTPIRYRIDLLYVPIFTLWNPFNVGLTYTVPSDPAIEGLGLGWRRTLPGVMAVVNQATFPIASSVPNDQFRMFSAGNFQYLDVSGNYGETGYENGMPQNVAKGYAQGMQNGVMKVQILGGIDMRVFMASLPPGPLVFKPGEAKVFSPNGRIVTPFGNTGVELKEGYSPTAPEGRIVTNVSSNLTAAQQLWFLMKTDKLTQPYRNRAPGHGFSLSFGKTTGVPYGSQPLHSGIATEFHNLTTLVSETQGKVYWPDSNIDEIGYSVAELASVSWTPIFSTNFGPRMTIGTASGTKQNRPTKGVLQSNPLAAMVLGDPASGLPKDHPANNTYEITYNSLRLGSNLTPNITPSKGFIATGYQSGDGLSRLIMCDIPLRPMASLVELMGWNPRGHNPYPPFQHNLIGNSDATPLIPHNQIVPNTLTPATPQTNLVHDDAYCANHLLFDDWFLSSIAPDPETFGSANTKDINRVYREYLMGQRDLVNRAYRPIAADNKLTDADATTRIAEILTSHDGWLKVASRLEVEGMFNVNSTSVEAWKALLGHAKSREQIAVHGEDQIISNGTSKKNFFTRGAIATDVEAGSGPGFGAQFANASEYSGYRSLTDDQIDNLARNIVEQVRLRGPFLSLSEFVNRQLSDNKNLALAGAIQTALNNLSTDPMGNLRNPVNSLSDNTMPPSDDKLIGVGYEFTEAATGASAYGVPGWIRQADILRPFAPILTVRDDSFTIRAYGDARDKNGTVIAQAWCEAVVKRTRDYTNSVDAPDSINPPVNAYNVTFGRRYEIVSFRWLSKDDV